jgi:hypothetical protein
MKNLNQTSFINETTINPFVYKKCIINKEKYQSYNDFFQNIFPWIDTSTQVIVPFIIMIFCNCNIIYKVILANKKSNSQNLKRLRKIKGMCIMILTVSIIFIVLELPVLIVICLIQGGWIPPESKCNEFLFIITSLMMYMNHIINFVSYAMTGTQFRHELLLMLYFNQIKNIFRFNKTSKNDELDHAKNGFVSVNLKHHLNVVKPNSRHLNPLCMKQEEKLKKVSIQRSSSLLLKPSEAAYIKKSVTVENLFDKESEVKKVSIIHQNFLFPLKYKNLSKNSESLSLKYKYLKNDLNKELSGSV